MVREIYIIIFIFLYWLALYFSNFLLNNRAQSRAKGYTNIHYYLVEGCSGGVDLEQEESSYGWGARPREKGDFEICGLFNILANSWFLLFLLFFDLLLLIFDNY